MHIVLQLGVACGQLASAMAQGWWTAGAEGRRVKGSETGIDRARGRWFRRARECPVGQGLAWIGGCGVGDCDVQAAVGAERHAGDVIQVVEPRNDDLIERVGMQRRCCVGGGRRVWRSG